METISVDLPERSYSIHVGRGLLERASELIPDGDWRKVLLITDSNVGPLYSGRLSGPLMSSGLDVVVREIPPGEKSKDLEVAMDVIGSLLEADLTRADLVVALGGGVVGDLSGFAASIYKRGVGLLQIPTTLMSQVDSAIGGKTGVNLPVGKNLVGTFYQPVAVISDVEVLRTLPEREFKSGLAEVAKYSFLRAGLFGQPIEDITGRILKLDMQILESIVASCSKAKAEVVTADEYDRGMRAILNYGHTLGHALEAAAGYGDAYTHGEAISVGMVFAALVAEEIGVGPPGLLEKHKVALGSLGLPTRPFDPAPDFDSVMSHMVHDKKRRGDFTMILLQEEGSPLIKRGLDLEVLRICYEKLSEGV